jgi:diguanylate cyclase (GGDEF)-like protein
MTNNSLAFQSIWKRAEGIRIESQKASDQARQSVSDDSVERSNRKELIAVICFGCIGVLLMASIDAYERLFAFTRGFEQYHLDEIVVFFPTFLALGLLLFSLNRIQSLRSEIGKRMQVEKALLDSERKYKDLSMYDDLTQLYNSRHFYVRLKEEINRAIRYGHPLCILLADIDNFKECNDNHGHLHGDEVLSSVGKIIRKCLRKTDVACRYGGEEFVMILPETEIATAANVAERIRKRIKAEVLLPMSNRTDGITVSVGVAQYGSEENMENLIKRVDNAMYVAKANGKNRISISGLFETSRSRPGYDENPSQLLRKP